MAGNEAKRISRELFLSAIGPSFGSLEPWVVDRLTSILDEEQFSPGDRIYAAGDPPDDFYFAREGRVEIRRPGEPPKIVETPRAFGMLDVLVERPRSHSAYAAGPLQLMRVRADAWFELLEDSFELARMLLLALTRAAAAHEERLWAMGRTLPDPAPPALETTGAALDIVARVLVLMQAAPLRGAGVQPLTDLAMASEEVDFAPGQRIVTRGVTPDRVLVLMEGEAEASRESPAVSWRGGPGRAVAGLSAFCGRPSAWEARAVVPTRALAFRLDDWFDVMEENFEMVRAALGSLAAEYERLDRELRNGS